MTTNRGLLTGLDALVSSAPAGGYSLPADVLDAHRTWTRVKDITVPDVDHYTTATAVDAIIAAVAAVAADEPVDLVAAARRMDAARRADAEVSNIASWPSSMPERSPSPSAPALPSRSSSTASGPPSTTSTPRPATSPKHCTGTTSTRRTPSSPRRHGYGTRTADSPSSSVAAS